MVSLPTTQYAKSGDLHIAYQVTGRGPLDLVLVPGFVSHLESQWEHPWSAGCLDRLASFSRLIRFDKRGTGLSDRVGGIPSLVERMDDVRAVMDAGVRPLGGEVRAGLHTGECEVIGEKVGGIAVHIGAQVAGLAKPGEILVSNTVKDLVAGSGLQVEDQGVQTLEGVPGEGRLFAVLPST
jgi:hypothetical protein